MSYQIVFKKNAAKELKKFPSSVIKQIIPVIDQLADNPKPANSKKLKGFDDLYRIRKGDFRVIYFLEEVVRVVEVRKIGHRKDVYR